jgi:hypothetical protein
VHGIYVLKNFTVTHFTSPHFTSLQNKITSHKSHKFTPHHYISHQFTYLHSIPTWTSLLVTATYRIIDRNVTYAGPSSRAVYGVGLRPLACCHHGFESHRLHGCLSVVCCVLSGRSLWDELITRPGESYWLWRIVLCDHETSWTRRP